MPRIRFQSLVSTALTAFALSASVGDLLAQETAPLPGRRTEDGKGNTRNDTGEIIVRGPNAFKRGEYCDFAVRTQEGFRKIMDYDKRSKFPVRINLKQMPGNLYNGYPVVPEVIVEPRYSPNVHVALCDGFRFSYLREELVRFQLLDMALRSHPSPGGLMEARDGQVIPDWLWVGVTEAIAFEEKGEPSELFRSIFKSGRILGVEEILSGDPTEMNTLSRAVYRASAGGLVLTLLGQEGGPARLKNFIGGLSSAPLDQEALLHKYFPGIKESEKSLDKWWNLKAATLAEPKSLDVLTIAETEALLVHAITVGVMRQVDTPMTEAEKERQRLLPRLRLFGTKREDDVKSVPLPVEAERINYQLSDYREFIGHEDLDNILQPSPLRLQELSYRSFPLYRPLIKRYIVLAKAMQSGDYKIEELDKEFASLTSIRIKLVKVGETTDDILNHHEATRGSIDSGAFKEIDRLAKELEEKKPDRKDGFSNYLDRVQSLHDE